MTQKRTFTRDEWLRKRAQNAPDEGAHMEVIAKLPPNDVAAEEAVLGACLADAESIALCAGEVEAEDFFRQKNGHVWSAIIDLWKRGEGVNQITVAHELSRAGLLDEIGGVSYLSRLVGDLSTVVGVEWYAKIVSRDSAYRRLVSVAGRIAQRAYEGGPDLSPVMDEALELLGSVQHRERQTSVGVGQLVDEAYERMMRRMTDPRQLLGYSWGYPSLDYLTGGAQGGLLHLIAGRTSHGKSAFALNMAAAMLRQNRPVLYVTRELTDLQITERLARLMTPQVDYTRIARTGQATIEDQNHLATALQWLRDEAPLRIEFGEGQIESLRSRVHYHIRRFGTQVLFVDHVDLFQADEGNGNRVQEVSRITRTLKEIALDFNIPVIGVSQLSRASENRDDSRPRLSDLRDGGTKEQDSQVVMILHRPATAYPELEESDPLQRLLYVDVAKNTDGPTRMLAMYFRMDCGQIARLEDSDRKILEGRLESLKAERRERQKQYAKKYRERE